MISAQDRGREFEKLVHYYLLKTNLIVLSEKEVRRKYGSDTTKLVYRAGFLKIIILDFFILSIIYCIF